jgi:hypothetical protein
MASRTKPYYSEIEAAKSLGVTVDEFRVLVRRYIVNQEEDMSNAPMTTYHAADLLLLRMFTGRPLTEFQEVGR